jgi:hypothetical protein
MSSNMENMLAQNIIDATRRDSSHRTLDIIRQGEVRRNASAYQREVYENRGKMQEMRGDIAELESSLKKANEEKKRLNKELRILMSRAQSGNANNQEWLNLLKSPLHIIADLNPDFKKNYDHEKFQHAKTVLSNMVNDYVSKMFANEAGYSDEQLLMLRYKVEQKILTNELEDGYQMENVPLLQEFSEELVDDYNERKCQMDSLLKKTAKTFK